MRLGSWYAVGSDVAREKELGTVGRSSDSCSASRSSDDGGFKANPELGASEFAEAYEIMSYVS